MKKKNKLEDYGARHSVSFRKKTEAWIQSKKKKTGKSYVDTIRDLVEYMHKTN